LLVLVQILRVSLNSPRDNWSVHCTGSSKAPILLVPFGGQAAALLFAERQVDGIEMLPLLRTIHYIRTPPAWCRHSTCATVPAPQGL
jgi:hypothetical protein